MNIGTLLPGIWITLIGLMEVLGGGILSVRTLPDVLANTADAFIRK